MIENDFSRVLCKDLHFLRRQQRHLQQLPPDAPDYPAQREKFQRQFQQSQRRYEANLAALPRPALAADLPILAVQEELKTLIRENQVVIISGETGSGKTTQIPQLCLALGLGARGLIGHTQPRRIAAKSVATRLAEELQVPLGGAVGYQVRFDEALSPETRIKLMTDGLLLAETLNDKYLKNYEVIIVDEAHERSLNIDFLLGYLHRLLPRRPDLKLIITSATIDAEKFSRHFHNAPHISVSGRSYPVAVRYQEALPDQDLNEQILQAIGTLDQLHPRGDILVFCATEREILDAHKYLERANLGHSDVLPLFGRLSLSAQQAVFHPGPRRRIILTTNVAETSLTVPRIHGVIDGGSARISRYSLRTKTQRLPIEPISQASANQRAGRCGRLSAGTCIRLYSEADFQSRPAFTEPEILRTNLAAVILQMLYLKLGDVADFPFVDAPDQRQINDGYRLLFELQAVDEKQQLTALGRRMAQLPIDPRFGRIVFAAQERGCLQEALIILAFLSLQDPRERPFGQETSADQRQGEFADGQSDFQSIINLFVAYQNARREQSNSGLRSWCKYYHLNFLRMREWRELVNQLLHDCRDLKLNPSDFKTQPRPEALPAGSKGRLALVNDSLPLLHEALLTGFLDQVGLWDERRQDYLGTRGRRFRIFPASVLAKRRPASLMAASIVETQQVFARTCAPIELALLERLAAHLCKSQLQNPHWSKKAGNVMAEETVSLYGLPLVAGRQKPFAGQDPALAHDIFIEEALVTGEINTRLAVIAANRALIAELEALEDRSRTRDFVDERAIGDFYRARLPESVHSVVTLEQWARTAGADALRMSQADLLPASADTAIGDYPEHLDLHGYRLNLAYEFDPSSPADGVTLLLPLAALNSLRPEDLERLVPAMLPEKIEALLRCLPKLYRRQLVPIPQFAAAIHERIVGTDGPLLPAICTALREMKGTDIPRDAFALENLEPHHLMNVRLLDGQKVIAEGRDLAALQARYGTAAAATFQRRSQSRSDDGGPVARWLWDELPASERLPGGIVGYPALTLEGEELHLRLHDNEARARAAHRLGVETLLTRQLAGEIKYLQKNLPQLSQISLYYHKLSANERYLPDLTSAAVQRCCLATGVPRCQKDYEAALARGQKELIRTAGELHRQLQQLLALYSQINERLRQLAKGASRSDIEGQLKALIYPNFIRATPPERLGTLNRLLQAVLKRLEKISTNPLRDVQWLNQLQPWEVLWAQHAAEDKWAEFFWLLQEYRVQLFAQELGTAQKVSPAKLEALAKELQR